MVHCGLASTMAAKPTEKQTTPFAYFDTQRFKLTYFEIYPEKVSYLNTLRQLKSSEWTGSLNL